MEKDMERGSYHVPHLQFAEPAKKIEQFFHNEREVV